MRYRPNLEFEDFVQVIAWGGFGVRPRLLPRMDDCIIQREAIA